MRNTMSALQQIRSLFGLTDDDEADGLALLRDILSERQAELLLTATYSRPYPNMQEQPTAVFPYTLTDQNGEDYGAGAKEFVIPDDGLDDTESPLVRFISNRTDIDAAEVDFNALASVEGTSADAELNESGDVEVQA